MNKKFIEELATALEMDIDKIIESDEFRGYENYDSLTELSVLAMLDSEFNIEIEMKEFNTYITVSDLINLVSNTSREF